MEDLALWKGIYFYNNEFDVFGRSVRYGLKFVIWFV
jgi:hypothetical protein